MVIKPGPIECPGKKIEATSYGSILWNLWHCYSIYVILSSFYDNRKHVIGNVTFWCTRVEFLNSFLLSLCSGG